MRQPPIRRSILIPHGGEVGIFTACIASAVAAIWALGWMQRRQDALTADITRAKPQAIDLGVHRHDGEKWARS